MVDDAGKPALVMEAYTTRAGTVIRRKTHFEFREYSCHCNTLSYVADKYRV
ncbi:MULTISPECIES: hypothetical protein [unclassified Arthrobacter]|uniref:hypothetical protein n=1 Tax=unclassified Arthrobacter TaxID=235627 RepID=UPI002882DC1D|nr:MULTISPECIES: hypothetical protein [unclassified Arthrobacter]